MLRCMVCTLLRKHIIKKNNFLIFDGQVQILTVYAHYQNVVWLSKLLQKFSIYGSQMPVSDTTCTVLSEKLHYQ